MSALCDEMERFGKGIGNAARYRIVEALSKGPRTVSRLVAASKISQPAVSQHLKTLKASNLVRSARSGKEIVYTLNAPYVLHLLASLTKEVRHKKKNQ
jgi:ArsR family transcriptional regulator, zinc-responsive transcriptional repressor